MDERVERLRTADECEQFIINVKSRLPDLAHAARRRCIELRAETHGAESAAEREALAAVFAYEHVLSAQKGKRVRASRTWQMIERKGIIDAVECLVTRPADPVGYTALAEMGMQDLAFESVVQRHPEVFSPEAVFRSAERLRSWALNQSLDNDCAGTATASRGALGRDGHSNAADPRPNSKRGT
jgi:hypothetical protein